MKTVLLIDDDEVIRTSITQRLAGPELKVLEAEDGKKGLELALKHHPDLIVLDENMPKLDGQAVLEHLRNDEWGVKAKVIAFTVNDDILLMNKNLVAGVTEYLDKTTVEPDNLVAIIQSYL